ncbi:MAG: tyrosine-type recombinase/integrase [Candidatus Daviesbacteria bacterium]|nr:tyrosine-type recombinase/integrase [Candidatus Daviesbacteria bacterium]
MENNLQPGTQTLTLEKALDLFLDSLKGKNRSGLTIQAYRADMEQFITYLHDNNVSIASPIDVKRTDISEYLSYLSRRDLTGASRARKLSAIREYFRFLEGSEYIERSPAEHIDSPKREKNGRVYLHSGEYTKMLSLAGGNPRDYAILQVFLQTGVRVSELSGLQLNDIDINHTNPTIKVSGKGRVEREIELEKKGIQAIKNYLSVRPHSLSNILFLNYLGEPLSDRGIRKLVVKYRTNAGITKKASCHSLRHTFATFKAERGVSPFQLQQWLGHTNLNTTQIYVHLGKQNAKKIMENTTL